MKRMQTARSSKTRLLVFAGLLGTIFCLIAAIEYFSTTCAVAENVQRSVQGRVIDASGTPIRSAIVYLSDLRTLSVESYITQEDGAYRFEQLSPNDDYKLWAQLDNKKSKIKTISSFDSRNVFRVIITIDTRK